MTESILLRDLSVVMIAAAATTWLCHWLKQPVVLGYLLAGLLIGPHTPPFALVKDLHSIHTMAELGLLFLMFSLGLEFSLPQLGKVGPRAAIAAILEIGGMLWIGYELGILFGWSRLDSIFLGAILSISSTTIIIKVLTDLKQTKEEFAQVVFGVLVLEDIAAIMLLTTLSGLAAGAGLGGAKTVETFLQIGLFVVVFMVLGLAIVPRILARVGRLKSRETLGITTLGLCLGSAFIAYKFGYSVALGAFLMGAIVGVSDQLETIEEWMHPVRDMFSAIFFVSAGLLIQIDTLVTYAWPIAIITLVTIIGKMATGAIGTFLAGCSMPTSIKAGMSLAQIGEFSFVFAGLALTSPQAGDFLFPMAVAVSALTTLWTPYGIRLSENVSSMIVRMAPERVKHNLNRYHAWISGHARSAPTESTVYSKYLVRLAVYAALLIGAWKSAQTMALILEPGLTALLLWVGLFLLLLPLILAVSYYTNHFLLLSLTELIVRMKASHLLQYIPIHKAYRLFEALLIIGLSALFFASAYSHTPDKPLWFMLSIGVPITAFLLRGVFRRGYLALEGITDQLMGLATSEPLRAAALTKEGPDGILDESMEKMMVRPRSPAVHQSIRSIGLREKTGASLIAIYRRGKLLSNPRPDTSLLANDILVILGEKKERDQARALLKP